MGAGADNPRAIDVAADAGNILLAYGSGHMEVMDPASGRVCAHGVLPQHAPRGILSATFAGKGSALLLVDSRRGAQAGHHVAQLWRVEADWLMEPCVDQASSAKPQAPCQSAVRRGIGTVRLGS